MTIYTASKLAALVADPTSEKAVLDYLRSAWTASNATESIVEELLLVAPPTLRSSYQDGVRELVEQGVELHGQLAATVEAMSTVMSVDTVGGLLRAAGQAPFPLVEDKTRWRFDVDVDQAEGCYLRVQVWFCDSDCDVDEYGWAVSVFPVGPGIEAEPVFETLTIAPRPADGPEELLEIVQEIVTKARGAAS